MGKIHRKGIQSAICAAAVAILTVFAPFTGQQTGFADTKDYDQEIAELEQKAEQIKKDNEAREQKIGSLKSDVEQNKQQMELIQDQITGINEEVQTYSQLITKQQHIGKNTALRLVQSGEIEAFRVGNQWRILKGSVVKYIRRFY